MRASAPAVVSVEGAAATLRRAGLPATLAAADASIEVVHAVSSTATPQQPVRSIGVHPFRPRPRVVPAPSGDDARARINELTGATTPHDPPRTLELDPDEAAAVILDQLRRGASWRRAMNRRAEPTRLADVTWTDLEDRAGALVLLVPVGSTEQHGPHLPLDTDSRIAAAIVGGAVAALPGRCVAAPAVAYGASGEHADFPGTLSIGHDALTILLVELARSADAFAAVRFVNGHGGNLRALRAATATLQAEGRDADAWSWSIPGADAHAGRTETSLLLAIAPDQVRLEAAAPGRVEPVGGLLGELRAHGVRAVSPNGVLGDPTGATAAEGERCLAEIIAALVAALDDGPPDPT